MGVNDRFQKLIHRLTPLAADNDKFYGHITTATQAVKAAYPVAKTPIIGSFKRGSDVRPASDADLLLVLRAETRKRGDGYKSSATVLLNVRKRLCERYAHTLVVRDKQAIVLQFGRGRYKVDIVPAFYVRPGTDNYPVYEIPDGTGGWLTTSPDLHNRYIDRANARSGWKLRNVTRLLKYWQANRGAPLGLGSFHLELLLASSRVCEGAKSYATCTSAALSLLADRECRALQDPIGVSGLIACTSTKAKQEAALKAARASANRASHALKFAEARNQEEACRLWDLVFSGGFPKR